MTRKNKILLMSLALILPALPACIPVLMNHPDNMDPMLALKLRKDFLQSMGSKGWTLEDVWVDQYFGNYSGCEVVYMGCSCGYTGAIRPVEIAGYTYVFPGGQELYAYKDSKFYTIKEAYEAGLLTQADVYDIGKATGLLSETN